MLTPADDLATGESGVLGRPIAVNDHLDGCLLEQGPDGVGPDDVASGKDEAYPSKARGVKFYHLIEESRSEPDYADSVLKNLVSQFIKAEGPGVIRTRREPLRREPQISKVEASKVRGAYCMKT